MRPDTPELRLDTHLLRQAMRRKGFDSVQDLADSLGLHRNTIGNYLSGKTGFPAALGRLLAALDLEPARVITLHRPRLQVPGLALGPLIDDLREALPGAVVVLFGSRARGTAGELAGYDLGVHSPAGIWFREFSALLELVAAWNASERSQVHLENLSRVDEEFLHNVAPDLVFLAGSFSAWCDLHNRAGHLLHE